jgi:hypothetical protein
LLIFETSGLKFIKVGLKSFTALSLNPQKLPLVPEAVSIVVIESAGLQVGGARLREGNRLLGQFFLSAGNLSSEFVFGEELVCREADSYTHIRANQTDS